jgi:hypothetical protein
MENLKAGIQFIRNMVDFKSHSKTFLFVRIAGNEGIRLLRYIRFL